MKFEEARQEFLARRKEGENVYMYRDWPGEGIPPPAFSGTRLDATTGNIPYSAPYEPDDFIVLLRA